MFDLLNIVTTVRTNPLYKHDVWYLDSGTTGHMICDHSWLYNYRAIKLQLILLGNNNTIYAQRYGDILAISNIKDIKCKVTLCQVLFVLDLAKNLLSLTHLATHRFLYI